MSTPFTHNGLSRGVLILDLIETKNTAILAILCDFCAQGKNLNLLLGQVVFYLGNNHFSSPFELQICKVSAFLPIDFGKGTSSVEMGLGKGLGLEEADT